MRSLAALLLLAAAAASAGEPSGAIRKVMGDNARRLYGLEAR